jgi:DNA-binding transcriptional ArsR family regulator
MQEGVSVIQEADRAAAMLDPARLRILERLREPESAAGLARSLGLPRQRVGYHVRELERQGLLRHVGERRKGNCVERLLQTSARHYLIAPETLGALGLDPRRIADRFSSAYLVAVASQAARDVGGMQERAEAEGKRLATLTVQTDVRFATAERQHAFAAELAEAITRLAARYNEPDSRGGRWFRFVVGGYPRPAPGRPADVEPSSPAPDAGKEES